MAKTKKAKKRNPPDATLRNVRATAKRLDALTACVLAVEREVIGVKAYLRSFLDISRQRRPVDRLSPSLPNRRAR